MHVFMIVEYACVRVYVCTSVTYHMCAETAVNHLSVTFRRNTGEVSSVDKQLHNLLLINGLKKDTREKLKAPVIKLSGTNRTSAVR